MSDALRASGPWDEPLDGPPRGFGDTSSVAIAEHRLPIQIDLRFDRSDIAAVRAFEFAAGLALPAVANVAAHAQARTLLWLGPDQWLLASEHEKVALAAQLERALAACRASVTDVSDLRAVVRITGPRAPDLLRKGCAIDLHPRAFGPGRSAVTALARVRALIHQVDAAPTFEVYVERTVADYFWRWLEDACVEYLS